MATESRLIDRLEDLDNEVKGWALDTKGQLRLKLRTLGVSNKIKLAKTVTRIKIRKNKFVKSDFLFGSVGYALRKKDQEIEAIAFRFARHGIFLEHGVGKNRPVGSGKAENAKKPWLSPVLTPAVEALADRIAEKYADIAADEVRINIPGILTTNVKIG